MSVEEAIHPKDLRQIVLLVDLPLPLFEVCAIDHGSEIPQRPPRPSLRGMHNRLWQRDIAAARKDGTANLDDDDFDYDISQ